MAAGDSDSIFSNLPRYARRYGRDLVQGATHPVEAMGNAMGLGLQGLAGMPEAVGRMGAGMVANPMPGLGLRTMSRESEQQLADQVARFLNDPVPSGVPNPEGSLMQAIKSYGPSVAQHLTGAAALPLAAAARTARTARAAQAVDDSLQAAGRANAAGYRTMSQVPNIREMNVNDAVKAAQGDPHLIEAGDRSGGFYLGAPRDIQSYDDLQAMRQRFDQRLKDSVEAVPSGPRWYDRYREQQNVATGGDPTRNLWQSKMQGTWSQGVDPQSEAQFALKEGMGALAGMPQRAMYSSQHDSLMRAIAARDPTLLQSGDKTFQYGLHVNPDYFALNPHAPTATGVNDFRYANEWGYKPNEALQTRDGDVNLTDAQHRFLDYETARAVERANATKLGGRSDWTGEQIQATPWVTQKAAALKKDRPSMSWDEAYAEANRTTPDFYEKHAANITPEMQPAPRGNEPLSTDPNRPNIPGHAPLADLMNADQRRQYAEAVKWGSGAFGRDVIGDTAIPGTGVGVLALPSETGTGYWEGVSNPVEIGRPLVPFNAAGSLPASVAQRITEREKLKNNPPTGPYSLVTADRTIPLGQDKGATGIAARIAAAAPLNTSEPMTLTSGLTRDLGTWEGFDPAGLSTLEGTPATQKVTTDSAKAVLNADAAAKALFGAQAGVGWHKTWDIGNLAGANSYFVPMDRAARPEEIQRLMDATGALGMGDVTSTHGGLLTTRFWPPVEPLDKQRAAELERAIGAAAPQRSGPVQARRMDSDIRSPAWGEKGAGTATDWMLEQTGVTPEIAAAMNANPGYGRVAGAMAQRDAPEAFGPMIGGAREDIQNVRNIAAMNPEYEGQGWRDRVAKYQAMLKAGGTLPTSVAIGSASVPLFTTAGFPAGLQPPQQRRPGTTLNSGPGWADQAWGWPYGNY